MNTDVEHLAQELLLLLEENTPDQIQKLIESVILDLRTRVTASEDRKEAAALLLNQVFQILMQRFATGECSKEDGANILLAMYSVFCSDDCQETLDSIETEETSLLKIDIDSDYESCVAYFSRYRAQQESLPHFIVQEVIPHPYLIVMPYLLRKLEGEALSNQEARAFVIAKKLFDVEIIQDIGSALWLLPLCQKELINPAGTT